MTTDSDGQLSVRRQLLIFFLFLVLAIAYTYPLARQISTHIPDRAAVVDLASDAAAQSWYSWWVNKALLNPHESVLHSDWIFYPVGMEMTMQPAMFLHGAMTIPLWWLDITTANNVIILVSFGLSGLAATLLGMYLFRSLPAALFCGFVYALCPYKSQHLMGHYQLMATETLPLVALSLVRLFDAPSRKHLVWAGIWLGFTIYTDYYFFAYALLLATAIFLYRFTATGDRVRVLRHMVLTGCVALAVAAPLLVPALMSASRSDYGIASGHEEHKADLLSFLVPSERQWVTQRLWPTIDQVFDMDAVDGIEHSVYVGWALLILCAIHGRWVIRQGGTPRLFALVAILFLVLAMGPGLGINGQSEFGGWHIPLPGKLLMEAPLLNGARAPARIFIVAILGFAVWAGYALCRLLASDPTRTMRVSMMAVGFVAVTALEYIVPISLAQVQRPPWLDLIRSDPAPGIVAHTPMYPLRAGLWQAQMNRKMLRVFLGRTDPDVALYYWRHDALRFLSNPSYLDVVPDRDAAQYLMDLLQIRYVVYDRKMDGISGDFDRILKEIYGLEPVYEDDETRLYRLPRPFRVFDSMDFTLSHEMSELQLLYGWSNRRLDGIQVTAWMTAPESILALPPLVDDGQYELSLQFTVSSPESLALAIQIGDQDAGSHLLKPGSSELVIPIDGKWLQSSGPNLLRLTPDRRVGLPHRAGMGTDLAPHGVPIEVVSAGLFTRDAGRALIRVGATGYTTYNPGTLIAIVDEQGRTQTRLFESMAQGSTADSVAHFITSAPPSATVAIAVSKMSLLTEGRLTQALEPLGLPSNTWLNGLNSLAVVGGKDGRRLRIDTGAAVADIVLGPVKPGCEAAIGLIRARLTRDATISE